MHEVLALTLYLPLTYIPKYGAPTLKDSGSQRNVNG
jgi:hypothetical protein